MSAEEKVIEELLVKFPYMYGKLKSPRRGRLVTPLLGREHFEDVFQYVTSEAGGFQTFHLVIGTDDGDALGFIYVLSNADKVMLLLKTSAPKSNPVIPSVCGIFPNALWHERELVDLFGAVVEGLPEGPSYPLPDGWPQGSYPLRKEWRVEYFDQATMTYNPPAAAAKEEGEADA